MARTDGTARGEDEFTQTIPSREGRRLSQNEDIVNVFDKPDEQRPSLLGLCHGEKTKAKSTFSVSQKTKESLLALAWRENEGEVNVFGKPEDQRELARFGLARKGRIKI